MPALESQLVATASRPVAAGAIGRNLLLLGFARFVTMAGGYLCFISLMWFMLESGGTALQVSLLVACNILPTALFSPFAGVLADRFDRKALMILSDSSCAAVICSLAVLHHGDMLSAGALFAGAALISLTSALHHPASNALLPDLVPAAFLAKANSLETTVSHIARVAGITGAGWAFAGLGLDGVLWASSGLLLVSALAQCGLIQLTNPDAGTPSKDSFSARDTISQLWEAAAYLSRHGSLRRLFWFLVLLGMLTIPAIEVVFPIIFQRIFRVGITQLSLAQAFLSAGFALGALLHLHIPKPAFPLRRLSGCFVVASAILLLFVIPIWPSVGILPQVQQKVAAFFALAFLAGIFTSLGLIPANVIFQTQVGGNMMGRVFGLMACMTNAAIGIGLVLTGWLTDHLPAHWLLAGIALILIAMSLRMRGKFLGL